MPGPDRLQQDGVPSAEQPCFAKQTTDPLRNRSDGCKRPGTVLFDHAVMSHDATERCEVSAEPRSTTSTSSMAGDRFPGPPVADAGSGNLDCNRCWISPTSTHSRCGRVRPCTRYRVVCSRSAPRFCCRAATRFAQRNFRGLVLTRWRSECGRHPDC